MHAYRTMRKAWAVFGSPCQGKPTQNVVSSSTKDEGRSTTNSSRCWEQIRLTLVRAISLGLTRWQYRFRNQKRNGADRTDGQVVQSSKTNREGLEKTEGAKREKTLTRLTKKTVCRTLQDRCTIPIVSYKQYECSCRVLSHTQPTIEQPELNATFFDIKMATRCAHENSNEIGVFAALTNAYCLTGTYWNTVLVEVAPHCKDLDWGAEGLQYWSRGVVRLLWEKDEQTSSLLWCTN